MVGGGIVKPAVVVGEHGAYLIFAAMLAAIIWEIYTVLEGLPVSGSHALIGGLIGGWIASRFFHMGDPMSGINLQSILVAFVGAVILVFLLRLLSGKRG